MKERLDGVQRWLAPRLEALPRPTLAQGLRVLPALVAVVALLVLIGRNFDTVDFPNYEAPEGYVPRPPPTTLAPGAVQPALAASIAGTTLPSIPPNVGTATLGGTVQSGLGAVPGAIVRLERLILGETQVLDVATDATGAWRAEGIGGGRYRVRAFLPPTLASRSAEVFLLPAGESRNLDLVVEEFAAPSVALASAPAPAVLGEPVNVAVRVAGRFVDGDGFVSTQGLAGVSIEVASSPAWVRSSPPGPGISDGAGQVVVTFTCRQVGQVQITATARIVGVPDPLVAQGTFECIDPTSLTTTTVPGDPGTTTTTAGGPSSSSTSTTFADVGD